MMIHNLGLTRGYGVRSGMADLFEMLQSRTFMQQLGYGLLKIGLVSLFPELRLLFRKIERGALETGTSPAGPPGGGPPGPPGSSSAAKFSADQGQAPVPQSSQKSKEGRRTPTGC